MGWCFYSPAFSSHANMVHTIWYSEVNQLIHCFQVRRKVTYEEFLCSDFSGPKITPRCQQHLVMPKICEGYKNSVDCESFPETTIWSCSNTWKTDGEVLKMFMADYVVGDSQLIVEVEDHADAQICLS